MTAAPKRFATLLVALLATLACSDDPTAPAGPFQLQPRTLDLFGDEPARLLVTDGLGSELTGRQIRFESLDTTVASVDSLGIVRGRTMGATRIVARAGGETDTIEVSVTGFIDVAAGGSHTCALMNDGAAWCWGLDAAGSLGTGGTVRDSQAEPQRVATALRFEEIGASFTRACARAASGAVECWRAGGSAFQPFGNVAMARLALSPTIAATSIRSDLCGVSSASMLYCASSTPVEVDRTFRDYTASAWRDCRVTGAGDLECRGNPPRGVGPVTTSFTPMADGYGFVRVATGDAHTCALDDQQRAWCITYGQAASAPSLVPGGLRWRDLDVSASVAAPTGVACGITTAGDLYCWGELANHFGGALPARSMVPIRIRDLPPLLEVSLAPTYGCVLARSGSIYCWGDNGYGQLGDGTFERRDVPVRVVRPQDGSAVRGRFATSMDRHR